FVPPWSVESTTPALPSVTPPRGPVSELLAAHPAACDALAGLLGIEGDWQASGPVENREAAGLLDRFPTTAAALAAQLGLSAGRN
ncbi:hypothetical protein ACW9HQ_47680, partial [Nocardia gipuzkoensis]